MSLPRGWSSVCQSRRWPASLLRYFHFGHLLEPLKAKLCSRPVVGCTNQMSGTRILCGVEGEQHGNMAVHQLRVCLREIETEGRGRERGRILTNLPRLAAEDMAVPSHAVCCSTTSLCSAASLLRSSLWVATGGYALDCCCFCQISERGQESGRQMSRPPKGTQDRNAAHRDDFIVAACP